MPRSSVTRGQLLKIEGAQEILDEIERRIRILGKGSETGEALKRLYYNAAEPIENDVLSNISSLPVDRSAKQVLREQVVRGRGPKRFPNAFVAMYQYATGGRDVPNPYWFEYGTVERATKTGHKTGRMRPTPFFRPAVSRMRDRVKKLLIEGLKRILVEGQP